MTDTEAWQPIATAPQGELVDTCIRDLHGVRNEQPMTLRGRLWFAGGIYVYYTPTHWRPLTKDAA